MIDAPQTAKAQNATEILAFVQEELGVEEVTMNSDIESELGCYGDDFDDLISKYSQRFNVNMDGYLWYFHTGEESFGSIGRSLFRPPNLRVQRIAVTPQMLLEFAHSGKWNVAYPTHQIPKIRYDMLIDQIIFVTAIIGAIYFWLIK